ncbi:MAG: fibronectin type III domain-containing protein [Acidimicrobiaceae bacterium]|nr:fibronectin type III domain-containing protein [Acidimicrobiaceae bacterium]
MTDQSQPPVEFAHPQSLVSHHLEKGKTYNFTLQLKCPGDLPFVDHNFKDAQIKGVEIPVSDPDVKRPAKPGRPSLKAGDGEITVSWSAPDDNGASIDRFEVRWRRSGGSWSKPAVSGSPSRYTVGGLRDGTSYEVQVRARNSVGWGDWSPSSSATPRRAASVPGAPTGLWATEGDGQLHVSWGAPQNGSPVTGYTVSWSRNGAAVGSRLVDESARSFTVTGLTNGARYVVSVVAHSAAGDSAASSLAAFPKAAVRVPDAPGLPSLTVGDGELGVSWSAPDDNGASIDRFEVRWRRSGGSWSKQAVSGSSSRYTVGGLRDGASYEVQVRARNSVGWSAWSPAAAAATNEAGSVSIAAGPVNAGRTNSASCGSGNDCHDLRYTISGLGSGPYVLECWFNGQRAWRGQWSGNASTGCYYSSAFSGTVQVAVDGVKSNTITVTGTQRRSEPDAPARPSLSGGGGSVLVSWSAPDDNGASIDRYEVRYRRSGRASWSNWDGNGSSRRLRIASTGAGVTYEVGVRARNSEGWGPWSPTATITTQQAQASVTISAGPVNSTRTSRGSCSGNSCHDLRYTINGLGSGRYTLECWFNGQRAWRGNWSGNSSTGCYYSSTFRGTIHVVIDGVKSNTITIR